MKQINVLVADSSPFVCHLLKTYLESAPDIRVIASATKGHEVVDLVYQTQPDVVTLNLELPDMNGVQTLLAIQAMRPTPVLIISGANLRSAAMTMEALSYGAVDFVFKFVPGSNISPDNLRDEIINKVRLTAQSNRSLLASTQVATVVESVAATHKQMKLKKLLSGFAARGDEFAIVAPSTIPSTALPPEKIIVIGAATGGPIALRQILSVWPEDFPHTIVVVQHLPPSFTTVLAEQLNEQLPLLVKEAADGDKLERGTVLVTPGWAHLQIDDDKRIKFFEGDEIDGNRPSINVTMQSVAAIFGSQARGILLTGIGSDGVEGLASIRHFGGKTFAQAPETCAIDGMPQRAIEAGVVDHIASPDHIARLLLMGY